MLHSVKVTHTGNIFGESTYAISVNAVDPNVLSVLIFHRSNLPDSEPCTVLLDLVQHLTSGLVNSYSFEIYCENALVD
jgi:hypothetical protein